MEKEFMPVFLVYIKKFFNLMALENKFASLPILVEGFLY